jgi:hypothetical protein
VSPVKYELGFISQKATFFIVTAVVQISYASLRNFPRCCLFVSRDFALLNYIVFFSIIYLCEPCHCFCSLILLRLRLSSFCLFHSSFIFLTFHYVQS